MRHTSIRCHARHACDNFETLPESASSYLCIRMFSTKPLQASFAETLSPPRAAQRLVWLLRLPADSLQVLPVYFSSFQPCFSPQKRRRSRHIPIFIHQKWCHLPNHLTILPHT